MRKTNFAIGEYYHVYNRGVDKRNIFQESFDLDRFFQSIQEFNSIDPIGSIYEKSFEKKKKYHSNDSLLVEVVAYCLNPNHYHFILKQVAEKGVQKFMHRLGGGYTTYFNTKYERSGVLFQGRFKAKHVSSNEYLLHLSVYINGNNLLGGSAPKLSKTSLGEYLVGSTKPFCNKKIILEQFQSPKEYKDFFTRSMHDIEIRKRMAKEYNLGAEPPS